MNLRQVDERVKRLREKSLIEQDPHDLQLLHDQLIDGAVHKALESVESEWGSPPTHFAFFVMGSAGRHEQSYWSDQDHGLLYEEDDPEYQAYFLELGKAIVHELERIGYSQCDGDVMASNDRWCKSVASWKRQLSEWVEDDTWESLRYLLTVADARCFYGETSFVGNLKHQLFQLVEEYPPLIHRLFENTGRVKKGIGLFGQLLPETKGVHQGKLDLKQTVLFPYVNGLRLMALKEGIVASSTMERMKTLPASYAHIKGHQQSLASLLTYRLRWQRGQKEYDGIHFVKVDELSALEKKRLKEWIREGHELYQYIEDIMVKGRSL